MVQAAHKELQVGDFARVGWHFVWFWCGNVVVVSNQLSALVLQEHE